MCRHTNKHVPRSPRYTGKWLLKAAVTGEKGPGEACYQRWQMNDIGSKARNNSQATGGRGWAPVMAVSQKEKGVTS